MHRGLAGGKAQPCRKRDKDTGVLNVELGDIVHERLNREAAGRHVGGLPLGRVRIITEGESKTTRRLHGQNVRRRRIAIRHPEAHIHHERLRLIRHQVERLVVGLSRVLLRIRLAGEPDARVYRIVPGTRCQAGRITDDNTVGERCPEPVEDAAQHQLGRGDGAVHSPVHGNLPAAEIRLDLQLLAAHSPDAALGGVHIEADPHPARQAACIDEPVLRAHHVAHERERLLHVDVRRLLDGLRPAARGDGHGDGAAAAPA